MKEKIKVFVISDHILSPSGVAHQMRNIVEACLKSGKFKFVCFGGAIKHNDYNPLKTEEWGDDLIIYPVDGFGTQDKVRSLLRSEKPDLMLIMSDPRFFEWLFLIENEVRSNVSNLWYSVWDNYPYPTFNRDYYLSNDYIVTISKLTDDVVRTVAPEVPTEYLPHAVSDQIFKPLPKDIVRKFRHENFDSKADGNENKMIFTWVSRNARRKQSGSLIFWFKEFLDQIGHDKATLIMHCDPRDREGQNLEEILKFLNLQDGQVLLSRDKLPPETLAHIYNMSDCTINCSDAEGFGISTLESLSCGTPVIVNLTGGLKEQVTDGKHFFGIGVEPASKAIIGSQDVPWIYEDRLNKQDFLDAMLKMYNMTKEEREHLGKLGHEHVMKNFNYDRFCSRWVELLEEIYNKNGSWSTRKNYKSWDFKKIA